jgi:hypothetical protein
MPPCPCKEAQHPGERKSKKKQDANDHNSAWAGPIRTDGAQMPKDVHRHDHQNQDYERDEDGDEHVDTRFSIVDCVAGGPLCPGILLRGKVRLVLMIGRERVSALGYFEGLEEGWWEDALTGERKRY